jgi:hypothetical protein
MLRTTPDALADRLLKRCLIISLTLHVVGFCAALPIALMRTEKKEPLKLTFIDLGKPIAKTLTKIEEEKQQPKKEEKKAEPKPEPPKPKPAISRPQPRFAKAAPQRVNVKSASSAQKTRGEKGEPKPLGPKVAQLPPGTPGTLRLPDELPGGGAEGARPNGKMLPRAPGPVPFDPNDSGGAKVAPGGRGPEEQTPMARGVPIGKKDAGLPFNPKLASMGGGRSGLNPDDNRPGGGPVDPQRRTPETVFLGGGGGGENLPKALPRIGGGGGAPEIVASNSAGARDPIRTGTQGQGPGEGGGVG